MQEKLFEKKEWENIQKERSIHFFNHSNDLITIQVILINLSLPWSRRTCMHGQDKA